MSETTTHYEALGVESHADKETIRAAYQERLDAIQEAQARAQGSKRPDEKALAVARDDEARVRAAWQVLSDPYQRGRYDATVELSAGADGAGAELAMDVVDGAPVRPARPPRPTRAQRRAEMDAARPPVFTRDGTQLELAETNRRTMAASIDVVLLGVLIQGITYGAIELGNVRTGTGTGIGIALGTTFGIVFLVQMLPVMFSGQSLGKRLTHTVLVDRSTGGLPTPFAVVKHYILPTVLLTIGQIGVIAGMFVGMSFLIRRDGLSFGDKFANTVVTIARERPRR